MLLRQLKIVDARVSFWDFCKTINPEFYKESRNHLRRLCNTLQAIYEGTLLNDNGKPYKRLMINMPPRMGKSYTVTLFCMWALGKNVKNKVITCSYNDDLASSFGRNVRDGIKTEKLYPYDIVYNDIFPKSKIKNGNAAFQLWALEGQPFSYLGAGLGGSITGRGASITIVDDPVKSAEDAFNENALEKQWLWYTGTWLSRLEKGGIQIVNMTRWSKNDICGRILSGEEADTWYVLRLEAMDEQGNMLCDELLDNDSYNSLKTNMDHAIFRANYHQEPVDIQGRLYKDLKTYTDIPRDLSGHPLFERIISYTDTADTGADYLCTIVAGIYQGEAYVLDVLYTKDDMSITEGKAAELNYNNEVNTAYIESNSGGRGFARNVERILWDKFKTRKTIIKWFHQSKNKVARILSNSSFVQEHIYFPHNWQNRFPDFYNAISSFQREGKNKHDDAADTLTGIAEHVMSKKNVSILKPKGR